MKFEHKVVPVIQTKVLNEAEGIVGAFVSVTGVVDSVKDRILPGAYQSTLKVRTPKGVWSHDWDTPVSKTLSAEELLPGDERLPTKTRDGEDWPTAAGALYVETQFNLGTTRGKDAFSDVVFFGDDQEWSIGYSVPPGGATMDKKTGVREISYIDLFEYSPVLFGAMPLTTTAGVKDAQEAWKAAVAEGKVQEGQVTEEERKDADAPEANAGDPAADAVQPTRAEAGFTDASQATITTPADPQHTDDPAAGSGTGAGVQVEPRPDPNALVETQVEVEAPKTAEFVVRLKLEAEEKVNAIQADVARKLAGPGADPADIIAASQEATKAVLEDQDNYAVTSVEVKAQVTLAGSYEERQQALRPLLADALKDFVDQGVDEYGYPKTYVTTEATFANRVVAAAYEMDSYDVRYFEAGYTFGPDGATLKTPREVRVEAAVVAKGKARAAEMKAARDQFRKAAGADLPSLVKIGRGDEDLYVNVDVRGQATGDRDAFQKALREALDAALKSTVADIRAKAAQGDDEATTGQPEATEAKGADQGDTVTLDDYELLELERLKLSL